MFGTHWSPKFALNYNADNKTQVYASWGRVYKAPTADDLYYSQPAWGMYGNPNLKPESGYTETLGITHQFDSKTSIQASIFQSEIHDAIRWVYGAGGSMPENMNQEKRRGFELSITKTFNKAWSMDAGYSYIRTELDTGSGLKVDPQNAQPNGYRLGLHYAQGAWKSNLLGTFGSGLNTTYFPTHSYAVIDFNVSYDINKLMTVYFKVNNLTNQEYAVYPNGGSASAPVRYPAAGRFFQLGMTYSF